MGGGRRSKTVEYLLKFKKDLQQTLPLRPKKTTMITVDEPSTWSPYTYSDYNAAEMNNLNKGSCRRWVAVALIIGIILFLVLAPVVPYTVPGGATGSMTNVHASVSYVLTRTGTTYWQGHLYWGPPPIA